MSFVEVSVWGLMDALAIALLGTTIWLLVVQAILLTAVAGDIALATGSVSALIVASVTLMVKGVLLPKVLFRVLRGVRIRREVELVIPTKAALLVAVAAILIAYHATDSLPLAGVVPSRHALPVAVALVLVGLGLMIGRRKALSQVAGLVIMENGVYLAALVTMAGLPLVVELGIAFDVLVGVVLLGVIAYRINETFDTINTDRLGSLRG
jgi:hydrogenase-4 component E